MDIVIKLKGASFEKCTWEGSNSWSDHWELNKGIAAVYCRGLLLFPMRR